MKSYTVNSFLEVDWEHPDAEKHYQALLENEESEREYGELKALEGEIFDTLFASTGFHRIFKLRHTPYTVYHGKWRKRINGAYYVDVEFEDVFDDVQPYIQEKMLYTLDIIKRL